VEERFEFPEDVRADLLAFKQRLEQLDLGASIRREEESTPRRRHGRRSLWGKISLFLKSLAHLSRSSRRLDALEDEVTNLRKAVVTVVESEFVALTHAVKSLLVTTTEGLERLSVDSARLLERERDALHSQIEDVGDLIRFERLTRQKAFTDFDRRLTLAAAKKTPEAPALSPESNEQLPTSVRSLLESFYFLLEERYRGTREEIKQRLFVYRNDFLAARERTGVAGPIIDLGCGRGELLEMLREEGFQAIGVDSNDTQLEAARRHGVAVVHADAIEHLRALEDNSVLAVTGIHIVEHIPFTDLIRLMQEVARVLKKGGVAIFETPNPRNLIVGATTFHFDPTHIRPLPPEVLQILLETVGFAEVEQRPLHPSETLDYMVKHHNLDRHVATLLFGPQDYAAIGVMR
jgi:O-antigen chain-terminating methyltransferase